MVYDTKEQAELEFVHDGYKHDAVSGLWHKPVGYYEGWTGCAVQDDETGKWATKRWLWY
jgi:hypothetical protein